MSGEYGYNTINGEDIAVVPGGVVRLGDRENIVEARSHSLRWNHLPDQSFVGGALKDSFYGGSGTFYGKDGNDEFYLYGGLSSTGGQIFAYGGNGNDMMAGTTGDVTFSGGQGQDYFSNVLGSVPQGEAVFDASMGAGDDTVRFKWTSLSTHLGETLLKQRATFEGGSGRDTLVLDTLYFLTGPDGARSHSMDLSTAAVDGGRIGAVTFHGFENYVLLPRNANVIDNISFGQGNDYLAMGSFRSRDADIRIEAGGRNDTVFGARQHSDEFIYGGAGNDMLVAASGYDSAGDYLYGGAGDDVMFASGPASGSVIFSRMVGGSGRDIFELRPGIRVTDFHAGEDLLAFNMTTGSSYAGLGDDVAGAARKLDVINVSRNDEDALEFKISHVTGYHTRERLTVHYDVKNGVLWKTEVMGADWADRARDSSGWTVTARLAGAPELSLEDFRIFDYL